MLKRRELAQVAGKYWAVFDLGAEEHRKMHLGVVIECEAEVLFALGAELVDNLPQLVVLWDFKTISNFIFFGFRWVGGCWC